MNYRAAHVVNKRDNLWIVDALFWEIFTCGQQGIL